MFFLPLIHTLPQTQNQKSTIKIKNQPQHQPKKKKKNQPLEQSRWIGDHGSWIGEAIWIGDVDRCYGSVLMEIGDGLMWIGVDGDWF